MMVARVPFLRNTAVCYKRLAPRDRVELRLTVKRQPGKSTYILAKNDGSFQSRTTRDYVGCDSAGAEYEHTSVTGMVRHSNILLLHIGPVRCTLSARDLVAEMRQTHPT